MANLDLTCTHCGKELDLPVSEETLRALDAARERIRAQLRERSGGAPSIKPNADAMASIWDRKPATVDDWGFAKRPLRREPTREQTRARRTPPGTGPFAPIRDDAGPFARPKSEAGPFARPKEEDAGPFGGSSLRSDAGPFGRSSLRDDAGPFGGSKSSSTSDAVSSWGFGKKSEEPARSTKPFTTPAVTKEKIRSTPPPVPAAEKLPKAAPKAAPKPKKKRDLKPSPLLAALAAHPNLNPGQRATVEMIYQRFAPGAPKADKGPSGLLDALDVDPNLNKGQAETLRTVVARFDKKR